MNLYLLLPFLVLATFGKAQNKEVNQVVISNKNWDFVYRNYDNPFEILSCANCDSIHVNAEGGIVSQLSKIAFTLKPNRGVREVMVNVECFKNGVAKTIYREPFSVQLLPNPNVYLGGVDFNTDLDRFTDEDLFFKEKFTARYDGNIPLLGVQFRISNWAITIGKKTYFGGNEMLSEACKNAFLKARKNTTVVFNYCIVIGPDGLKRKITWNASYKKKSGRNSPKNKNSEPDYTTPESGG